MREHLIITKKGCFSFLRILFTYREKHTPCSAALPVLLTNPIKEDNLIRNLAACFNYDCSCKYNQL